MLHLHLPTPKQQPLRHALDVLAGLTCELPAIGGNCIEVPAGGYHLPTPIPKQVSLGKRGAVDDFNGVRQRFPQRPLPGDAPPSACSPELSGVTHLPQLPGMLSNTMPHARVGSVAWNAVQGQGGQHAILARCVGYASKANAKPVHSLSELA